MFTDFKMSSETQEEETNVYFVIPSRYSEEEECDNDIKIAFQSCVEHDLCPQWIMEEAVLNLQPTKRDVFVFQEFVGRAFDFLKAFKSFRVVGARCILACLIEGTSIPDGQSPVFTVAMRGLIVTSTGFDEVTKKSLAEKIEYMGGVYSAKLRQTVTHVVAHSVGTPKYEAAVNSKMPLMTAEWVLAVWEASQHNNVHATDEEFMKFKCTIFHSLVITCSGLNRKEKDIVKDLITKYGGEFSGNLESERTKVLLIKEPTGDKYKFAKRWNLPCLLPSWIHDSIKQGHALPIDSYQIKTPARSCSTPEADVSRMLPDFSIMSTIQGNEKQVDETVMDDMSICITNPPKRVSDVEKYMQMVDQLDLSEAKRAKVFLDGCNVYLSGFNAERTEKLRRVLNGGGAIRFNEISESVSHVILGEFVLSDIKLLKTSGFRPHVVTVEWLIESIKQHGPAPEEQFSCFEYSNPPPSEPPSPLSKKGLQLLQSIRSPAIRPLNMDDESQPGSSSKAPDSPKTNQLVQQYLQSSQSVGDITLQNEEETLAPAPPPSNELPDEQPDVSMNSTVTQVSSYAEIFKGLTFFISGYSEEKVSEMEEMIKEFGGKLVSRSFKGIPDYCIVPIHGGVLHRTTNEIVTLHWLGDCYEQAAVVPILYQHQPVAVDTQLKPLSGCVISITTYLGSSRSFIVELAQLLGAETQEMFARVDSKTKNAKASSHLICPEPRGQKYKAACKWKLPALTHEWLLACAREGKHVPEEPFLVLEDSAESITKSTDSINAQNNTARLEANPKKDQDVMGPPNTPKTPATTDVRPQVSTFTPGNPPAGNSNTPVTTPDGRRWSANTTPVINPREWPWDMNQPTPKGPNYVSTPDTPYGAVFKADPSPNTRKQWKRYIDTFPQFPRDDPPLKKRRQSTPLSELKRQCWAKFGGVKNGARVDSPGERLGDLDRVRLQLQLDDAGEDSGTSNPLHENSRLNSLPPESNADSLPSAEENQSRKSSGTTTGINTQLMELNEILTSASRADLMKNSRGLSSTSGTPQSTSSDSKSSSVSAPAPAAVVAAVLPESLDINADCVEWVDPVITQQDSSQESNPTPPKFMLSSIEDRERCEKLITSLGGSVSVCPSFDPSASHLVCNRPARSEKLLASIASGKWVLHRSYLDRCMEEGRFLQEDAFEWGNPNALPLQSVKLGNIELLLAQAAYRWRCKLSGKTSGAFEGIKAIMSTSSDKTDSFKRLILAGGGEVLNVRPPYRDLGNATICLVDQSKVSMSIDIGILVKNNIPCVTPLYLNNFLLNDPPPDPLSCVVPQYKTLVEANQS